MLVNTTLNHKRICAESDFFDLAGDHFFSNIEHAFEQPLHTYKTSPYGKVILFQIAEKKVIIKCHRPKNYLKLIKYQFVKTRVQRSWQMARFLNENGIHTLHPLAIIEPVQQRVHHKSYLIYEHISGCNLVEWMLQAKTHEWDDMLLKLSHMVKQLFSLPIRHRDLNLSNFIITPNGQLALIDLDGVRCVPSFIKQHFQKRDLDRIFHYFKELGVDETIFLKLEKYF